jgi:hypothetical protein
MYTRKELLDEMCECAENANNVHFRSLVSLNELDPRPQEFKPGAGDKFIFNMILNDNLALISESYEKEILPADTKIVGYRIMARLYYPAYGWFDRQQDEEARR